MTCYGEGMWGGDGNDNLHGEDDSGAYDLMWGEAGDDYLYDSGNSICDGGSQYYQDTCECDYGIETDCEA